MENNFSLVNPGTIIESEEHEDLVTFLEDAIQNLYNRMNTRQNSQNLHKENFIGAHPISLTQRNFSYVVQNQDNFLVCEKTDGVRYLLILLTDGTIFLTGRYSNEKDKSKPKN
jgi:hypothetical protein